MAQGYLQVDVVSDANSFPVQDADILVARTEEPDEIIEETRTNSSGQTENLPLDAPPLELSLSPEETERPYAEYTIRITAPGFEPFVVSGTDLSIRRPGSGKSHRKKKLPTPLIRCGE